MERKKSKKQILVEEIERYSNLIEEARAAKKDSAKLREELIKLIIDLDAIGNDEKEKIE